jgi:hypothetical protein
MSPFVTRPRLWPFKTRSEIFGLCTSEVHSREIMISTYTERYRLAVWCWRSDKVIYFQHFDSAEGNIETRFDRCTNSDRTLTMPELAWTGWVRGLSVSTRGDDSVDMRRVGRIVLVSSELLVEGFRHASYSVYFVSLDRDFLDFWTVDYGRPSDNAQYLSGRPMRSRKYHTQNDR